MNIKGLTLIELLVVISIIVIATGAVVINNDSSKTSIELFNTKNSIISNIYKAKESALSGGGATPNTNFGIGVWFPDSAGKYYYIYRNIETNANNKGYASNDEILEKVMLPNGIRYAWNGNSRGILFTPPTPHVAICSSATACNETVFKLDVKKESGEDVHTITVNKAGLIE